MYLAAISASLIAAFQLSGWIQDVSFAILQRPPLNNLGHWGPDSRNDSIPLLKLPRIGIFRHLADDVNFDAKSVHVLKCQVEYYNLFIEYGTRSFEPTIDLCERVAPFIITYFTGPNILKSEAEQQYQKIVDSNLYRFQRVTIFDLKKNTVSILSGKGGYSDSHGTGRRGQLWYFGTNRNYGSIMLGSKPFPHAPRSKDDRTSYFTQESFYLPAGKTVTFDTALFMPSHSLGTHLNRGAERGSRSARVHHWPEICASILNSVDPKIARVEQGDDTRYFLSRPFVVTSSANVGPSSSFSRLQYWLDFCQAPGGGGGSSMGVPRVHLLDTLGGPQRHWRVDDDYNGDVFSTADDLNRTDSATPTSCEMEQMAPPGAGEGDFPGRDQVRRACGALHSSQSPYSAQSPCDVQRVYHLRPAPGHGSVAETNWEDGPLSCLEDVIASPHLRPELGSDRKENSRTPGKQAFFASGRGLADLWARDAAFSDSMSAERNLFVPVEDALRAMAEGEQEEAMRRQDELWWGRGSSLRNESDGSAGDHYRDIRAFSRRFNRGQTQAKARADAPDKKKHPPMERKRVHRAERAAEDGDGVGSDLVSASGGTMASLDLDATEAINLDASLPLDSLLDGRVEEYKELLRVVHAFSGVHRTHRSTSGTGRSDDAHPPPHLVVRSLLAPLMDFHATGGTLARLSSDLEVTPAAPDSTGATAAKVGRSPPDYGALPYLLPRLCVLTPRLLSSMKTTVSHLLLLRNIGMTLNDGSTRAPPSRMHWEALVEAIPLTSRQYNPTARPTTDTLLYGAAPGADVGGGIGVVEAQGGTKPKESGTPLAQPPPACDSSRMGRGLISYFNRLLLLSTLKQVLLPFFAADGLFLCDSPDHQQETSTLYLCSADTIKTDTRYSRNYLAQKLREFITVLSLAEDIHYVLDAWQDTERDAAPLADQLSSDLTRQARKLKQMRAAESSGKLAAFEGASSNRGLVTGLLAMVDAIEGKGHAPSSSGREDTQAQAHAVPLVNLHLSTADAQVFLFVLPEQFQLAQGLVNRWHKQCEGANTCFLYVKTHIVVVHAEDTYLERPPADPLNVLHWDREMSREAQPSIRASLLLLRNALERGGLPNDLVVALIGLPAALSFPAPGTQHNLLIPPVEYGAERKYNLSAPLLFSSAIPSSPSSVCSSRPGACSDPRAFAGTGEAVMDMIRDLQSSGSDGEHWYYHQGGNTEVTQALLRYQRLHPQLVLTDPLEIFNKAEGNRRWYWMTDTSHPLGLLQAAKDRALYLYVPNKDRENNAIEAVIDLADYGDTLGDAILFNVSYCRVARAMAIDRKEYLPTLLEAGAIDAVKPAENASYGDELSIGRWLNMRHERQKCNLQKNRLLLLLWAGDTLPSHSWPPDHRYGDRGLRGREEKTGNNGDAEVAYDAATGQPVWYQEEAQGQLLYSLSQMSAAPTYTNVTHEFSDSHSHAIPLVPYGLGVFTFDATTFAKYVSKVAKYIEKGMVLATTSFLLQFNRGMNVAIDANRDTYVQDMVLLKFAELTKYLHHFRQSTPLESYRMAAAQLQAHMSGRGFKHFGHNPYTDWDLMRVRDRYSERRPLHQRTVLESIRDDTVSAAFSSSYSSKGEDWRPPAAEMRTTASYMAEREQYGFSKVGGDGAWGERGGALASRVLSNPSAVPDMPHTATTCELSVREMSNGLQGCGASEGAMHLSMGEGRGPDAGPPIERYLHMLQLHEASSAEIDYDDDYGFASMYFARAYENRHLQNPANGSADASGDSAEEDEEKKEQIRVLMPSGHDSPHYQTSLTSQDAHLGPSGVGREALGNVLASAAYSTLAGVYSVVGPHHASLGAYAKSLAYADYYTVTARRLRWGIQRDRQQTLLRLKRRADDGEEAEALVARARLGELATGDRPIRPFQTHFLTMANKMNDKLSNLIYTAKTSGVSLSVVGLEEEPPAGEEKKSSFDYADKVVAYYAHLSQSLREGRIQPDDVVVMLDAYDVLLFPHSRRIGTHLYESSSAPIMFCAENGVYPEPASQYMYPHPRPGDEEGAQPHRFLNSGCVAGRAGQLFRMVQAAYDLRDAFKNDQQFYVKYALTHPDLVALDHSSHLFFTAHKSMHCCSRAVVTNSLSFDYYYSVGAADGENRGSERRQSNIGVLHANNLAGNRLYHVTAQAYLQATNMHLQGPDGPTLLEAIWAIVDDRPGHAARLLLSEVVQRNVTSKGGINLLSDWLLLRHLETLGPHVVKIAAELKLCEYSRSGDEGLLGLFGASRATGRVSVPPPYRDLYEQAGLAGEAVQCSYVAHLRLRDSLAAINGARAAAGLSQLPEDSNLICGMPGAYSSSSTACHGFNDHMGAYARDDPAALDALQRTLGQGADNEYQWESSGAAFELQQRRLAYFLRTNVDKCVY